MYTIKTKSGILGCVNDSKTYVVGFNNLKTVSRVAKVLKSPPKITLTRQNIVDVTEDVVNGLNEIGVKHDFEFTSISLDTEAILTVEKSETIPSKLDVEVDLMDAGDFMFMSFSSNIGLIMPYKTHYEDSSQILFKSSVIDPCNDINTFKKFLQ